MIVLAVLVDKGRLLLRLLRSEGARSVGARLYFAWRRWLKRRSRVTLDFGGRIPPPPATDYGIPPRHAGPGSEGAASLVQSPRNLHRGAVQMLELGMPGSIGRGVVHLVSSDPSHPRGGVDWHVAELRDGLKRHGWFSVVVWVESSRLMALWGSAPERLWTFELPSSSTERSLRQRLAVGYLTRALGCSLVHVHDLSRFERPFLLDLELPVVMSLHDFQLYCRRPHLMESTTFDFCAYSRDHVRCRRCLEASGMPETKSAASAQDEWRSDSAALLRRSAAVIAPSRFIAKAVADLFSDLQIGDKTCVIKNERATEPSGSSRVGEDAGERVRVVFVGQFTRSKGSAVFAQIAYALARDPRFSFRVVGGIVDHESLRLARAATRVKTSGWYRRERLAELLDADTDVVALVSVVPESWSYTLTEVLTAGTPVLAFDLGAVGERLRRMGRQRWLVPRDEGAAGFVRRLREHAEGGLQWPRGAVEGTWSSEQVAQQHAELYESCSKLARRESSFS